MRANDHLTGSLSFPFACLLLFCNRSMGFIIVRKYFANLVANQVGMKMSKIYQCNFGKISRPFYNRRYFENTIYCDEFNYFSSQFHDICKIATQLIFQKDEKTRLNTQLK